MKTQWCQRHQKSRGLNRRPQDPTLLSQAVTRLGGSGSREKAPSGHGFTKSPDGSGRSPASRWCILDGDVTGPNWRPYRSVTLGSKGDRNRSPTGRRCPTQGPSGKTMLFRGLGSCMCVRVCVCSRLCMSMVTCRGHSEATQG